MRILILGLLTALSVGCNETSRTNTGARSDPPNKVTVQRPVTSADTELDTKSADPANTEVNVRDRDGMTKTPFDQSERQSDIDVTANIRKRIVDLKMSVNSQNIKVVTQDGMVTLRGPVETEQEKQKIEEIAHAVAGADKVDSQLEINQK